MDEALQNITTQIGIPAVDDTPYELTQGKMFKDTLIFLFLLFAIFYFMIIRPQQKKHKKHASMLDVLRKGDEVMTTGGVIGKITKFEGDHIMVLEVAQGVQIKMARSSISRLMKDEPANDN